MNKKECGVNKNLFKKYEFNEHIWFQNKSVRGDLLQLAQRCVKISGAYWMKKAGGDHWITLPSIIDAEKEALNTWLGATLDSGTVIDSELIHTFFSGDELQAVGVPPKVKYAAVKVGSCPNIYQKMVVPLGPQFVTYNQQAFLNTWYDDMTASDESFEKIGKLVLVMIYGALCNGKVDNDKSDEEAERIYKMVVDNDYDNVEFRFLMNWLAAIAQSPGINLQTNVWLIGALEGLGKGTLIDIMRHILGAEFVGELNQTEIECGWNDHLVGKQLLEVNEFDSTGKMTGKAWGKWLKNHTIEPTFKVRQRNVTSYSVLHIGNFIGTSNNVEQTFIDANDRRNQFINTSSDPFWVKYAANLQLTYFKKNPKEIAAGFASILNRVKVDMDLIAKSFNNQLRSNVINNSLSIIEEWIENDSTITQGKWMSSAQLYEDYKTWFRINNPSASIPSMHIFGKVMKASSHVGVESQKARTGIQYKFGPAVIATSVKLEDAVAMMNRITGGSEQVVVFDLDEDNGKVDFAKMTPLEKMRAHLMKQVATERKDLAEE